MKKKQEFNQMRSGVTELQDENKKLKEKVIS